MGNKKTTAIKNVDEITKGLPQFSLKEFAQPVKQDNNQSEQYKILLDLQDSSKNLELKTEINKPFSFAVLKSFSDFLRTEDFIEVANIIDNFRTEYFKLSISKKRMGRKEIVDALKNMSMMQQLPQNAIMNQLPVSMVK